MSAAIISINLYMKERITFMPWLIIPAILFILGHSSATYNFILLYNLLWAIFFFRVFDDFFCWDYDLINKEHNYQQRPRRDLLILVALFGFLFLSSLLLIYPLKILLLNFGCLLISILLYLLLRRSRGILFISLIKYPVFLYMVASITAESNFLWVIIGSSFFILREVIEEFFHKRNKNIEYILIGLMLGLKLLMRTL